MSKTKKLSTVPAPAAETKPATPQPAPVPPPDIDPLRVIPTHDLRPALLTMIETAIASMDMFSLQCVAQSVDLIANEMSCATPFESFFRHLLGLHFKYGLTPDLVIELADEEFRVYYDEQRVAAARFVKAYSEKPALPELAHAAGGSAK